MCLFIPLILVTVNSFEENGLRVVESSRSNAWLQGPEPFVVLTIF